MILNKTLPLNSYVQAATQGQYRPDPTRLERDSESMRSSQQKYESSMPAHNNIESVLSDLQKIRT